MAETPQSNSERKMGNLSGMMETLYPILDMFLDLDDKVKEALAADEDLAQATYARVHGIGAEAAREAAHIDVQKLAESLGNDEKAALLLNDFFGDWFFNDKTFEFKGVDEVRDAYLKLSTDSQAFETKTFEGHPHLLVPSNLFKMDVDFFKGENPAFPLPLQSCLVLEHGFSPFAVNMLKKSAKAAQKEVEVLLPEEVAEKGKPNDKQLYVVLAPSVEELQKGEVDWETVRTFAQLWEEKTVPLVGLSPELVAAIHVMKGQTPEEACGTAGLKEPTPEFMAQLANPVFPETPAEPAPATEPLPAPDAVAAAEPAPETARQARTITDPDDLGETL